MMMRKFEEKALVDKLDKILRRQFGTNLAFHEFSAGYGIADLVFAPNFSFKKNVIARSPITNFHCLKLLLSMEEENDYTLQEIVSISSQLTSTEVKKQIGFLIKANYLVKAGKDSYIRPKIGNALNPIQKIVAIEVKLKDHKGGLTQAKRYQYFADESYLAILKEAEKNINFEEFNKHNIGLILFDSETQSIEIKSPQPSNQSFVNSVSLFAKEMMMSRFINLST